MKKKLIYLFLVITLLACSRKENIEYKYYNTGQIERKIYYPRISDSSSFNAQYFYKNGNLKIETTFINGKRENIYIEYFEGGKIEKVKYYLHGLKHGTFKEFNNNGYLMNEECYINDSLILNMIAQVDSGNGMVRHVYCKPLKDNVLSEIGVLVFTKEMKVFENASFYYDVVSVDTARSQFKVKFYNKRNDYLLTIKGTGISANGKNMYVFKEETYDNILTINYPKGASMLYGTIYLKKDTILLDFPFFKQF